MLCFLHTVEQGFRQGKLGYVDVLGAQRTLFETREQLIEALAAYHTAVADVQRLVGQSLEAVDMAGDGGRSDDEATASGAARREEDQ